MSTTRRMGHGLAFDSDEDLAVFAAMSRQGKHLNGVDFLGRWTSTDGTPEEVIYDLAYEKQPTDDCLDNFRAAGWIPVVSMGELQIFKAAPGTPPVHSTTESRREELTRQRNLYLRHSLISLALLFAVGWCLGQVAWHDWLEMALLVVCVIPVACTVMPLVGYWSRLRHMTTSS